MRLSNMADYAVLTMCAAARHCGTAARLAGGGTRRLSSAQLAQETGLPLPTVQKLVSLLAGAGLLRSVRGANGGIQLARPAAAISIADIVEAVEGPITLTACCDGGKLDCALESGCNTRPHWGVVNEALRGALAGVPLTRFVQGGAPA